MLLQLPPLPPITVKVACVTSRGTVQDSILPVDSYKTLVSIG